MRQMIEYTDYDKRNIFEAEIEEKIHELLQQCEEAKIPIFISAAVKNDADGTEYKEKMYDSRKNDIILREDRFQHFSDIANGYRTVPPIQVFEVKL